MNNPLREALEVATKIWHKSVTGTRVMKEGCQCPACHNYRRAIQSADKWQEPDEATHQFAPLWFTYPGSGGWFPACNSERDDINSMFRAVTFVLAKENHGPPPEDWQPEKGE